MLSRTRSARSSRILTIGLYRILLSRNSKTRKLTVCQRKPWRLIPSVSRTCIVRCRRAPCYLISGRAYDNLNSADEQERNNERVDRDRFREAQAYEHRNKDWAAYLGIAPDGFHGLTHAVADTDSRAESPDADSKTRSKRNKKMIRHDPNLQEYLSMMV